MMYYLRNLPLILFAAILDFMRFGLTVIFAVVGLVPGALGGGVAAGLLCGQATSSPTIIKACAAAGAVAGTAVQFIPVVGQAVTSATEMMLVLAAYVLGAAMTLVFGGSIMIYLMMFTNLGAFGVARVYVLRAVCGFLPVYNLWPGITMGVIATLNADRKLREEQEREYASTPSWAIEAQQIQQTQASYGRTRMPERFASAPTPTAPAANDNTPTSNLSTTRLVA